MYEKETDFCGCRRIDGCRGCDCQYGKLPSDLLNANIEALAQDETDQGESGNQGIVCQSKSKVKPGCTYYDCGPCIKVYNEEGRGNYSKCFR